ncbi:MAG: peptide chain release factor N(5)-glutamine methyltransferase [Desulfobulbaceae bacterium]|uniref:Release factor glutamine methyltransferase n=1 Tax=Candidatus Desulfobia pelagia TaxID=2841692 RepID=A0A8J6NCV3_9BACT|nr:peptide chain release factor N(5)-glutamine methyltransferase [Candidatus Desulfobia pelagia]
MKTLDLYQSSLRRLKEEGVPDAEIEASLLLGHVLNLSRAQLFLSENEIPPHLVREFEKILARRLLREPFAYIAGEQEFWSLPFHVSKDVLIPRPETEILLEVILQVLQGDDRNVDTVPFLVLDMGTGSGVISVVLAKELQRSSICSVDLSLDAQKIAFQNAVRHGVDDRIHFVNSNWLGGIRLEPLFDLVVSNPPYVASETFPGLQPEVQQYEPRLALDGGEDGMEQIHVFAPLVADILKPEGRFFMEIGADQGEMVMDLFESLGSFDSLVIYDDYAGLPRIFHARRIYTAH